MIWTVLAAAAQASVPFAAATAPAAVPLPHAEYMKACLTSGGMTGHYPTIGSADIFQVSPAARLVRLSVLAEPGANVTVSWLHPTTTIPQINTTLFGSTSMAFSARSVKLSTGGTMPVSWCARVD